MKKNIETDGTDVEVRVPKPQHFCLRTLLSTQVCTSRDFRSMVRNRMGAPITAYNRIGESEIRVHSNIYHPDYVVVVDETLLHSVDVTNGLKEDGAIVINTPRPKEEILPLLNGYKGSVYTIDAHKVSMETLGKYFPNSPMLAAIVKVADIMDKDVFLSQMQASYEHKFAKKPEVIDGNMRALKMAFEEVK